MLDRLSRSAEVLLLLDFDGTISEIATRHEDATLLPGVAGELERLARKAGHTVGVLSGRSLDDVARRVGVPGLIYAGNHGLEIDGAGLRFLHPEASTAMPALAECEAELVAALAEIPGARVENKTLTLTVHFRETPAEWHQRVESTFRSVAAPPVGAGRFRVTSAKAALELRPAVDWDKGRALELIRSRLCADATPIYFGDDATDEDAFRAAQAAGGFGVFVGPAGTGSAADYRVESPGAVAEALAELAGR